MQCQQGFLLPVQRLVRLLEGQGVWEITVTVVLGGLQCDGFLLLETLLLVCERFLLLVHSRRVLDR